MSTTPHNPNPTSAAQVLAEQAALNRIYVALIGWIPRTNADWATRARTLALIKARQAGWWTVLSRVGAHDHTVCFVYVQAAVRAACCSRAAARSWRESAQEWQARADGRPTSDAAGALSNWRELGVTV